MKQILKYAVVRLEEIAPGFDDMITAQRAALDLAAEDESYAVVEVLLVAEKFPKIRSLLEYEKCRVWAADAARNKANNE